MLEIVPLVFEGVEGFIFDFPPSPATAHDLIDVFRGDDEVGDPGEVFFPLAAELPVLQQINPDVFVGGVNGEPVDPTEAVQLFRILCILEDKVLASPLSMAASSCLKR